MLLDVFMTNEVMRDYNIRFKVFSNGHIDIRKYHKSILYVDKDFEPVDDIETNNKNVEKFYHLDDVEEFIDDVHKDDRLRMDNLSRSRNLLIDYAIENENEWKSFVTLTFKENVTDIDIANKEFHKWRTQMSRCCKKFDFEFKYLGVPEYQKRGAVHYHLLTNLPLGSQFIVIQQGKDKMYDVRYWNKGFSSAFDIDKDTDDNFNVALYLVKYFYKDIDNRLFGNKKILKSNNLKSPDMFKLKNNDIYKCAYGYILEHIEKNTCTLENVGTCIRNCEDYSISYDYLSFNLQEDINILKDILQDNEEF